MIGGAFLSRGYFCGNLRRFGRSARGSESVWGYVQQNERQFCGNAGESAGIVRNQGQGLLKALKGMVLMPWQARAKNQALGKQGLCITIASKQAKRQKGLKPAFLTGLKLKNSKHHISAPGLRRALSVKTGFECGRVLMLLMIKKAFKRALRPKQNSVIGNKYTVNKPSRPVSLVTKRPFFAFKVLCH